MANTWTARTAGAVAFASNRSMISVVCLASSARVVRVYRIWALNNQTGAVSNGPVNIIEISRITTAATTAAGITGTAITPVAHDTNNATITNLVASYHNATTGISTVSGSTYRRVLITVDEPAAGALSPDEYWNFPIISEIFNAGYRDSNVEPITLRPGEGVEVRQPGANATGLFEFAVTFTVANS